MSRCFAEVDTNGKRIAVHFPYDQRTKDEVKAIPGARFVPKDKGGPYWVLPLDLTSGRRLREVFGPGLVLGDALKAWGRDEVQRERNLSTLTRADDAKLERLYDAAPLLGRAIDGDALPELGLPAVHALSRPRPARPYQRADIRMMAINNVLNANQPGTGKTLETIGALVEAGATDGLHIVIAPRRSLVNVWAVEWTRWTDAQVFTSEDPKERLAAAERGLAEFRRGAPSVVIGLIPNDIRVKKLKEDDPEPELGVCYRDFKGNRYTPASQLQVQLQSADWTSLTIDEFHKMGLNNRSTLLHIGLSQLKSPRRYALSGTPMGGKPRKLWPVLNWLHPDRFTSFWRWADEWLEVDDNGFGKVIGDIKPGREDAFYEYHAQYMVRRLKRDALPGLPEKAMIDVPTPMTPKQAKQYGQFEKMAEVALKEGRISASNVLSEYLRLRQIANARLDLDEGAVTFTADSGKLDSLLEKLDEEGFRQEGFGRWVIEEGRGPLRAIVATEFKSFARVVARTLAEQGIACETLTGDTKDSGPMLARFLGDDPEPFVIVMTTQTGGVSLNLEPAGSIHALDESWNPDDMEQLFDRADRGGRTTPLRCYTYRTPGTIHEYIAEVAGGKSVTNANVLDVVRLAQKAKAEREEQS